MSKEEVVNSEEKTAVVTSFHDAQLSTLKTAIEGEQVAGSYNWHEMRRAGLKRRMLVSDYQIVQLLKDLEGRSNKKYRKHYEKHQATLNTIKEITWVTEEGKNTYKIIGDSLKDLEASLIESAELVSVKRRTFSSKSKAVGAKVAELLASMSDAEVVETEEYREAV